LKVSRSRVLEKSRGEEEILEKRKKSGEIVVISRD